MFGRSSKRKETPLTGKSTMHDKCDIVTEGSEGSKLTKDRGYKLPDEDLRAAKQFERECEDKALFGGTEPRDNGTPARKTQIHFHTDTNRDGFDEKGVKALLGFDPDDPNVTVKFVPMGSPEALEALADGVGIGADTGFFGVRDPNVTADGNEDIDTAITDISELLNKMFGAPPHAMPDTRFERAAVHLDDVLEEVGEEVMKAVDKFPSYNSPHEGKAVIEEELDELWDEIKANRGRQASARKEAIQVAATAIRYVLDLDPR